MNTAVAVIIGLVVLGILAKFFQKTFWGLILLLVLEIIAIIVWPQILVSLADLAIKVRELFN